MTKIRVLALLFSVVYHGRSWLYTSVMVAMIIIPRALRALGIINPIATYTLLYNLYPNNIIRTALALSLTVSMQISKLNVRGKGLLQ